MPRNPSINRVSEHCDQPTMSRAKLTEAQIPWIHARLASGESQSSVARSLGVSPTTIMNVARGATWSHVTICRRRLAFHVTLLNAQRAHEHASPPAPDALTRHARVNDTFSRMPTIHLPGARVAPNVEALKDLIAGILARVARECAAVGDASATSAGGV